MWSFGLFVRVKPSSYRVVSIILLLRLGLSMQELKSPAMIMFSCVPVCAKAWHIVSMALLVGSVGLMYMPMIVRSSVLMMIVLSPIYVFLGFPILSL